LSIWYNVVIMLTRMWHLAARRVRSWAQRRMTQLGCRMTQLGCSGWQDKWVTWIVRMASKVMDDFVMQGEAKHLAVWCVRSFAALRMTKKSRMTKKG